MTEVHCRVSCSPFRRMGSKVDAMPMRRMFTTGPLWALFIPVTFRGVQSLKSRDNHQVLPRRRDMPSLAVPDVNPSPPMQDRLSGLREAVNVAGLQSNIALQCEPQHPFAWLRPSLRLKSGFTLVGIARNYFEEGRRRRSDSILRTLTSKKNEPWSVSPYATSYTRDFRG